MRETLTQTKNVKEAVHEINRLDELFSKKFNRNPDVEFYAFSAGSIKTIETYGITMEWKKENEKDAQFFRDNVLKT